jgi:hypothetical protein
MQCHSGTHSIRECFKKWFWLETKRKSNVRDSGCTQMRNEMFELTNIRNWQ